MEDQQMIPTQKQWQNIQQIENITITWQIIPLVSIVNNMHIYVVRDTTHACSNEFNLCPVGSSSSDVGRSVKVWFLCVGRLSPSQLIETKELCYRFKHNISVLNIYLQNWLILQGIKQMPFLPQWVSMKSPANEVAFNYGMRHIIKWCVACYWIGHFWGGKPIG